MAPIEGHPLPSTTLQNNSQIKQSAQEHTVTKQHT
jgi:hypothetical protein